MVEYLKYELQDGYIHSWLVAGPYAVPVSGLDPASPEELRSQVLRQNSLSASDILQAPVERDAFQIGDRQLEWRYYKCLRDHLVDLSAAYRTRHYLRAWAYAQIVCPSEEKVVLTLTTDGPADVWVNRRRVYRGEDTGGSAHSASFEGRMLQARNGILVRFEQVAARECHHSMALRIVGLPADGVSVELPVPHTNVFRRQKLERVYGQAYLEHGVVLTTDRVVLRWDDEIDEDDTVDFWTQDWREHIQSAGTWDTKPGDRLELGGQVLQLEEGPHRIALLPPAHVIERYDVRYMEYLPFHVLVHPYSQAGYGTYTERRREALRHAAQREDDLYGDIARLALNRPLHRGGELLVEAMGRVNERQDGSTADLVGLLSILCRYPKAFGFLRQLKSSLQDCVLGFRYWLDEPGSDVMSFDTESHAILFHTCEILAGQLFPDAAFANAAQPGSWHLQKGQSLALDWLRARGAAGFVDWDSPSSFEQILLALSHLADLAQNQEVAELAAVTIDKLLFSLALNSFQGAFGSTHAFSSALAIKSGQLQPTSPISRLLWGMGVWNQHIRGVVALACSDYELPSIIADIAADPADEMWNHEQHPGVNKVSYRTPDYLLASAQDYHPGQKGDRQHIWQATLGPDAVVFVNHPACMSEEDARRPNFWRGNAILPRVAQWKDALIAVHSLPDDDRLGFTHAYWPAYEFDEYVLQDRWAFARKGDAYLALAAQQGLELVKRGPNGYRELRSPGQHNVWLCFMGRQALDDSFAQFQERVLALEVDWHDLGVRCSTLRNQTLAFGWEGPFLVDGQEQPLSGFRHYDNPYCVAEWPSPQMDIQYGGYLLRLDYS